jgi:hypothetical protein
MQRSSSLNPEVQNASAPQRTTKGIAGIPWISEQMGLSGRQCRRLAKQRKLPGVFRSQKGGRWKANKVQFLDWFEGLKTKTS